MRARLWLLTALPLLGATTPAATLTSFSWPLEAGNRWVFTGEDGQEGLFLDAMGDGRLASRGPSVFWGGQGFTVSHSDDGWRIPATHSYLGDAPNEPAWLMMKLPLRLGDAWTTGRFYGDTRFTFTATAAAIETIETPAGTFEAWRIEYRLASHLGTERDFDAWFADGVGIVQIQQVQSSTLGEKTPLAEAPVFSLSSFEQRAATASVPPQPGWLSVEATADGTGQVGAPLPVRFALRNTGDAPFDVIGALDASDAGWRYPKISIEIAQVGSGPVNIPELGRCGMMNPLEERDLRQLRPGESLDPFGPGSFGHQRLSWAPEAPGTYRIQLVYDFGDHEDWEQADASIRPRLESVPTGTYRSPVVEVEVTP